jgi:hypothetical protein
MLILLPFFVLLEVSLTSLLLQRHNQTKRKYGFSNECLVFDSFFSPFALRFHQTRHYHPLIDSCRFQHWARQVQAIVEGAGKGISLGVSGLCIGIGSSYRVRGSGVMEVDWNDVL